MAKKDPFANLGFQPIPKGGNDPFASLGFQPATATPIPEKEPGIVQSIAQGVAKPFLKLGVTAGNLAGETTNLAKAVVGKKPKYSPVTKEKPFDFGYLGKVGPINGPLDAIGTGAEVALNFAGGGAVTNVAKSGLKGAIKQGVKQSLKEIPAIGAGFGVAQELQEEDPSITGGAIKAATGAAVGVPLAVLGGAAPVVGAVARPLGRAVTKTKDAVLDSKIADDLVKNIFTTTKSNRRAYEAITGRNINPEKELVKRGIVPEVIDGKADFTKGKDTLGEEYKQLNEALDKQLSRYKGLRVSPEEIKREIAKAINGDRFLKNSGNRSKVEADVLETLDNLAREFGGQFDVPGIQDIKKAMYQVSSRYKKVGQPDFTKVDSASIIARAMKNLIEEKADDVAVKELNGEIGKIQELTDFIVRRAEGTAVRGGRLGLYAGRTLGALSGSAAGGGFLGTLVGTIGGDAFARVLQKNAVVGPLKRFYLSRSAKDFENPILGKTIKYLQDIENGTVPELPQAIRDQILRDFKANTPLMLPEGNLGGLRSKTEGSGVIPVLPSNRNIEPFGKASAKTTAKASYLPQASSKTQATITPKMNPNIKPTLPQASKTSSKLSPGLEPLIQEARKYKSADSFARSQGMKLYHGSPKADIIRKEGFRLLPVNERRMASAYGDGIYFTTRKSGAYADSPDKLIEAYVPSDLKLFDAYDRDAGMLKTKELVSQGYDGVRVNLPSGEKHLTIFDPSVIKTKSQLEEIWKKANPKTNLPKKK